MSRSISFQLQGKQSLKQSQRLMMSPQMQQAISLLQLPIMELQQVVDMELEQNPVLDYDTRESIEEFPETPEVESSDVEQEVVISDENFDILKRLDDDFRDHFAESGTYSPKRSQDEEKLKAFLETSITDTESLFEQLMEQAKEYFETDDERHIAELVIGNLDEYGFFNVDLEQMALVEEVDLELLQEVVEEIQGFEPAGVAARDLQHAFQIQLQRRGGKHSLAYRLISDHFDDLLHNRIPQIVKTTGISAQEVRSAVEKDLVHLQVRPGANYGGPPTQHIVPDVALVEENGHFIIRMNDDSLPSLRLNRKYLRMLEDPDVPTETRNYVKTKVLSGKWLMKNIVQRNSTLERIVEALSEKQREYFAVSDGKLKPLTMKSLADELEVHESTIARAVANKYLDCSRGIVALRDFFTNAYETASGEELSSTAVKDELQALVDQEDKKTPLSDEKLSKILKEKGIPCARRTVAKYRKILGIGTAQQRKSYS